MHSFLKEQPDLNWYNPEVREELAKVVRFWMNRGTDGFRLDTVNFFAYDQQLRDNPQRDPSEPILEKGQAKILIFIRTPSTPRTVRKTWNSSIS